MFTPTTTPAVSVSELFFETYTSGSSGAFHTAKLGGAVTSYLRCFSFSQSADKRLEGVSSYFGALMDLTALLDLPSNVLSLSSSSEALFSVNPKGGYKNKTTGRIFAECSQHFCWVTSSCLCAFDLLSSYRIVPIAPFSKLFAVAAQITEIFDNGIEAAFQVHSFQSAVKRVESVGLSARQVEKHGNKLKFSIYKLVAGVTSAVAAIINCIAILFFGTAFLVNAAIPMLILNIVGTIGSLAARYYELKGQKSSDAEAFIENVYSNVNAG